MLSKVEASLEYNQVLLRSEAKNFTEVAALACRGENASASSLSVSGTHYEISSKSLQSKIQL